MPNRVKQKNSIQEVCKVSKKKGAKGMPSDGPGKHDPAKPQKNKSEVSVFDKAKGVMKNERPRKTRI